MIREDRHEIDGINEIERGESVRHDHDPRILSLGRALAGPTSSTWMLPSTRMDTPDRVFSSGRYVGGSVVASNGDEVVVLWRQRGLSPGGERFDGPVLALYTVREGRLARAQMFYFDTPALVEFLARASGRAA